MKYKIIKSFFASAFAVCILYGFIRNGYETAVSYASNLETAAQTQETTNAENDIKTKNDAEIENNADSNNDAEIENNTDSNDISQSEEPESEQSFSEEDSTTEELSEEISVAETSAPTLSEYLSKLTCGGCGRNCPLTNPRCHNGATGTAILINFFMLQLLL